MLISDLASAFIETSATASEAIITKEQKFLVRDFSQNEEQKV